MYIAIPSGVMLLGMAWYFSKEAVRSWVSTNWLMRVGRNSLWLNLRSYRHVHYPPGRTVLCVPYDEITLVRRHTAFREVRTNGRCTKWREVCLEILLNEAVTAEVREELAVERRRREETSFFGISVRSTMTHVPVTVHGDNTLRVMWLSRVDWVTPGIKRALETLRAFCRIGEPVETAVPEPSELSDESFNKLVLELVQTGQPMNARRLLREYRGYNLREAKEFIEILAAKV